MKFAIVGGGISGLSLAYFIERSFQEWGTPCEIVLFDDHSRLGGKVGTQAVWGCAVEEGADSVLLKSDSPLDQLITHLNLSDQVISPRQRSFAIQRDGVLHEVPLGLLKGFPQNLAALWRCSLISPLGKCAATLSPLVHGSTALFHRYTGQETSQRDISIAEGLRRKFGSEVSRYLFETVFGGIHSGDAEQLSL
ncbi:NAD(P)-binding protein, partial [bacterium]|nr:NAD(P)-binding protein [bacterium]